MREPVKLGVLGKMYTLSCRQELGGSKWNKWTAESEQRRFFPQHEVQLWKGYCDSRNNWTALWRRNLSRRVKYRDGTFFSGCPWNTKNSSLWKYSGKVSLLNFLILSVLSFIFYSHAALLYFLLQGWQQENWSWIREIKCWKVRTLSC